VGIAQLGGEAALHHAACRRMSWRIARWRNCAGSAFDVSAVRARRRPASGTYFLEHGVSQARGQGDLRSRPTSAIRRSADGRFRLGSGNFSPSGIDLVPLVRHHPRRLLRGRGRKIVKPGVPEARRAKGITVSFRI